MNPFQGSGLGSRVRVNPNPHPPREVCVCAKVDPNIEQQVTDLGCVR